MKAGIKIGLEREAFLVNDKGRPVVVPNTLPHDECGLLVEARGDADTRVAHAVYSLVAAFDTLARQVDKQAPVLKAALSNEPFMNIPRETALQARRLYTKGLLNFQNIYGHKTHNVPRGYQTASIHVSLTQQATFTYYTDNANGDDAQDKKSFTYNTNFDWLKIFQFLDHAFAGEIKAARRRPGFYELKPDGRIEYRSLPNTVDIGKLINVLEEIK